MVEPQGKAVKKPKVRGKGQKEELTGDMNGFGLATVPLFPTAQTSFRSLSSFMIRALQPPSPSLMYTAPAASKATSATDPNWIGSIEVPFEPIVVSSLPVAASSCRQ
eukprot:SAG22_NODE_1334_length_4700_cov_27.727885_6_plen_107_part_00